LPLILPPSNPENSVKKINMVSRRSIEFQNDLDSITRKIPS
jgi:hypothetical protein